MKAVAKILGLGAAGALVYALLFHPTDLANGVQALIDLLEDGAEAIITFVQTLFS